MPNKRIVGIDLSQGSGEIDWNIVANSNLQYAILRLNGGMFKPHELDNEFLNNYYEAKRIEMPVGLFFNSCSTTIEEIKGDADFVLENLKDKQFEYPIFLGFSDEALKMLNKKTFTSLVKTFCKKLERYSYWVGVYIYDELYKKLVAKEISERYDLWVQSLGFKPKYANRYKLWQVSLTEKIKGLIGFVHLNHCYINYPEIMKKFGKNGYEIATKVDAEDGKKKKNTITSCPTPKKMLDGITYYTEVAKNVVVSFMYKSHFNTSLSNHFKVKDFACKIDDYIYDKVLIHNKLVQLLERVYKALNCSKIVITKGYVTIALDKALGGYDVYHTTGRACHFICYDKKNKIIPAKEVCCLLEDFGNVNGIGYVSEKETHIDTRLASDKMWFIESRNNMKVKSFKNYFHKI